MSAVGDENNIYDPAKEQEILRIRDTNNMRKGGAVTKSLAVARSINGLGNARDKKYDFLFEEDETEPNETPRNQETDNGAFDSARYGPNTSSTKKMLERQYKENIEDDVTMPSTNYHKNKNSSKVREAINMSGAGSNFTNPFKKQQNIQMADGEYKQSVINNDTLDDLRPAKENEPYFGNSELTSSA